MLKQIEIIKRNIEYILESTSLNDTLQENYLEIQTAINEINNHFIDDGR